jgi:hypothetical protein
VLAANFVQDAKNLLALRAVRRLVRGRVVLARAEVRQIAARARLRFLE